MRLIRKTGASALPVYFCGHNSVGFQLLGMIHPQLRTAFLLQEFLQQEGKTVEVRVGSRIPTEAITGSETIAAQLSTCAGAPIYWRDGRTQRHPGLWRCDRGLGSDVTRS